MESTWRNVALVDALSGALTAVGAALLESEALADERLVVITLLGPPSTQRRRAELFADLLAAPASATSAGADPESALTLLASVTSIEEDWTALVLDASIPPLDTPAWGLLGAFCALSSLVVSCFDDSSDSDAVGGWFGAAAASAAPPALPAPFTTLFQTLLREHAVVEVHELLPKLLTLDLSPRQALWELASASPRRPSALRAPRASDAQVLDDIVELKRVGVARVDDVAETQQLAFFTPYAPVKRVFGVELTGELLQQLLQAFAHDAINGEAPDVGSAWDGVVESRCAAVAADALATYVDCIRASAHERPPVELDAFNRLHDEFLQLAVDVFHAGAKPFASARRRSVRDRLKASIAAAYVDELQALRANSRAHCEEVRAATWAELTQALSDTGDSDSVSFAAVLDTVQRFDELYSTRASGPEKATVLREFYRHDAVLAFQRLEALATRALSEQHLQGLRDQLEAEFEARKAALVAHFQQEEVQLRACMARELETMHKVHQARSSRAKLDDGEAKRARDALSDAQRQNAELASQRAVLEHAHADALRQTAALARKADELEQAVRQEMTSRAELVDTLAAALKSGEAKESTLRAEAAELRHELGEKTFRVENELKELAAQLKKTTEEKDELQKQLNAFFLRITALPAALQQQLFCSDGSGDEQQQQQQEPRDVQFADALRGFMSA
ncbi:hypothetical protein PybrP1_009418 [[Pythium] brassicae (nom. inval.)]|nr:hypothetical protein PybrP1_009418 [[Pythium] brassicae (nom. inval.)]